MIKEWTDFIGRCNVRQHVIFLVDYDMAVAEHLVHGVTVVQHAPAPVGSQRHQRDEGPGERRAEPFRA